MTKLSFTGKHKNHNLYDQIEGKKQNWSYQKMRVANVKAAFTGNSSSIKVRRYRQSGAHSAVVKTS